MGIVLKRIYMENYKLFEKRTVEFTDALTIFDGPNGYGKTSTFDAIELLITGDISRVYENESISAKLGYAENFLAKDQDHDVLLKGEFYDSANDKSFVIARRIPHIIKKSGTKKRDLNPKSLRETVKTYFLSCFDSPEDEWKLFEEHDANEQCARFFGAQNISLYTLLHYVRQEDRLSFFKKSEEKRTEVVEGLFGLEEYRKKLKRADSMYLRYTKEYNLLEDKVVALRTEVNRRPSDRAESVDYEPVAQGKPAWDKEHLGFRGGKTGDLLQELLIQVDGVQALCQHRDEFFIDTATKAFRSIPEDKRSLAILAWKVCQEHENAVDMLRQRSDLNKFCRSQDGYLQKVQYSSVKWEQLCMVLGVPELASEFTSLAEQIAKSKKNQSELQKSLIDLDDARNLLHQQAQKTEMLEDGTCPYCGHNWDNIGRLNEQFNKTKERLQAVLGREAVNGVLLMEQCKNLFQQQCAAKWEKLLRELERDVELQIFCQYTKWQDFRNAAEACVPVMSRLETSSGHIMIGNTLGDAADGVWQILRQAESLWTSLSAEYVALNQQFGFVRIFRESFSSMEAMDRITPEMLEKKRQYIRYQYRRSFDEGLEELRRLEEKIHSLGDLCGQLKQYKESLTNAVNAYRKQLISQIEIPFFLYSSRLLQSYHGGQGVVISTKEGDKVRFTAPGREHDVLYTMSSGQLSAVLLAFALSLNQIYAGNAFRTMLIDDPIQCMDDINMVSMVDLLVCEFADSQVILSTHEDTFAKYIGYKYGRYGLSSKAVSLRDG